MLSHEVGNVASVSWETRQESFSQHKPMSAGVKAALNLIRFERMAARNRRRAKVQHGRAKSTGTICSEKAAKVTVDGKGLSC